MKSGPRLMDPVTLADTEMIVISAALGSKLHVVALVGCTATVSKVDSADAISHDTATQVTVDGSAAAAESTYDVVWPYYLVSASSASCRVCLT